MAKLALRFSRFYVKAAKFTVQELTNFWNSFLSASLSRRSASTSHCSDLNSSPSVVSVSSGFTMIQGGLNRCRAQRDRLEQFLPPPITDANTARHRKTHEQGNRERDLTPQKSSVETGDYLQACVRTGAAAVKPPPDLGLPPPLAARSRSTASTAPPKSIYHRQDPSRRREPFKSDTT